LRDDQQKQEQIVTQWQPQQDPRRRDAQPPATPPQFLNDSSHSYQQPQFQPRYQPQQQPHQYRQPQYQQPRRFPVGIVAAVAVILLAGAGGTAYVLHSRSTTTVTTTTAGGAPAQPETEAGVRTAATQFYSLYSASQWDAAWADLSPATQAAVPKATWTAEHEQCTSASAGMAREIKGITMAGSTAVVQETIAGALSKIGTASDAWTYADGRWGLTLPAADLAIYSHGSVKADVAAAKKAGDCAS
jgi:hypothetical protein